MDRKYVWSHMDFDNLVKEEAKLSRQRGFEIGGVTVTKIIRDVWKANNAHVTDFIKPKKIKGWKKNGGLF